MNAIACFYFGKRKRENDKREKKPNEGGENSKEMAINGIHNENKIRRGRHGSRSSYPMNIRRKKRYVVIIDHHHTKFERRIELRTSRYLRLWGIAIGYSTTELLELGTNGRVSKSIYLREMAA